MQFFEGSTDQNKLKNIDLNIRYLSQKHRTSDEEFPLGYRILMLRHVQATKRKLGALEALLSEAVMGDMLNEGYRSLQTPDWELEISDGKPVTKIDSTALCEELLNSVLEHEKKRNRNIDPKTLENVVSTVFWKTMSALTPRWSKTKLKREGINLEDYGQVGPAKLSLKVTERK